MLRIPREIRFGSLFHLPAAGLSEAMTSKYPLCQEEG